MTQQFGIAGIWDDLNDNLIVGVETFEDNSSESDLPLVTKFTITNGAQKSDNRPDLLFEEVILTVGVPPNLYVAKHTDLVGGESFTYEHRSRYSDLGKILFSVDGTVSPKYLLRVKRAASKIPINVARLSIISYIKILKDINLHKWLKEIIETMPIPGSDTTQAEIEAQKDTLRNAEKEITDTKKQLESVYGFIIRKTDTDKVKVNQHSRIVEEYLNHTTQGCSELIKMLDTYNSRTLESNRQSIVSHLSQEALKLDQATEGLS